MTGSIHSGEEKINIESIGRQELCMMLKNANESVGKAESDLFESEKKSEIVDDGCTTSEQYKTPNARSRSSIDSYAYPLNQFETNESREIIDYSKQIRKRKKGNANHRNIKANNVGMNHNNGSPLILYNSMSALSADDMKDLYLRSMKNKELFSRTNKPTMHIPEAIRKNFNFQTDKLNTEYGRLGDERNKIYENSKSKNKRMIEDSSNKSVSLVIPNNEMKFTDTTVGSDINKGTKDNCLNNKCVDSRENEMDIIEIIDTNDIASVSANVDRVNTVSNTSKKKASTHEKGSNYRKSTYLLIKEIEEQLKQEIIQHKENNNKTDNTTNTNKDNRKSQPITTVPSSQEKNKEVHNIRIKSEKISETPEDENLSLLLEQLTSTSPSNKNIQTNGNRNLKKRNNIINCTAINTDSCTTENKKSSVNEKELNEKQIRKSSEKNQYIVHNRTTKKYAIKNEMGENNSPLLSTIEEIQKMLIEDKRSVCLSAITSKDSVNNNNEIIHEEREICEIKTRVESQIKKEPNWLLPIESNSKDLLNKDKENKETTENNVNSKNRENNEHIKINEYSAYTMFLDFTPSRQDLEDIKKFTEKHKQQFKEYNTIKEISFPYKKNKELRKEYNKMKDSDAECPLLIHHTISNEKDKGGKNQVNNNNSNNSDNNNNSNLNFDDIQRDYDILKNAIESKHIQIVEYDYSKNICYIVVPKKKV